MCATRSCTRLAIEPGKRWTAGRSRKTGSRSVAASRPASSVPTRSLIASGPENAFWTVTCWSSAKPISSASGSRAISSLAASESVNHRRSGTTAIVVRGPRDNRVVSAAASVRRRETGILVVGAVEPEIRSWLHAAGHDTRAARNLDFALRALGEGPADLVIADRERGRGADAAEVARTLRADPRLGDAWLLAITTRSAQAVELGADDCLARPFTRAQLLARADVG